MSTKYKIAHFCYSWDGLFIRPGDPEMDCCGCAPEVTVDTLIELYGDVREENQGLRDKIDALEQELDTLRTIVKYYEHT